MRIIIFLTFSLLGCFSTCYCQKEDQVKVFFDSLNEVQFSIKVNWYLRLEDNVLDDSEWVCMTVDSLEAQNYVDCYESIIFRYKIHHLGFEKFIRFAEFFNEADEEIYGYDRFSDRVPVEPILKEGYKGFYYLGVCGISCKETGFHSAAGECDHIIIGDSNKTVEFSTNGRAFDETVRNLLIKSLSIE